MPALRTEITEITTGLAMLGFPHLERALEVRSRAMRNVDDEHYDRLEAAYRSGGHGKEFTVAWRNGVEFARSAEGLRGRPPAVLEWKGGHRPPGYDQIPADLRVDHVYLVSCKYGSNILANWSPASLFDRVPGRRASSDDWFQEVAPGPYQALYAACRRHLGEAGLPAEATALEPAGRAVLKRRLPRRFSGELAAAYRQLAQAVADASAERWRRAMPTRTAEEEALWRLLRLQSAPYFVLGESSDGRALRYRVDTPWDLRNRFRFRGLAVGSASDRRQPVVWWRAELVAAGSRRSVAVDGHVEVRWSHGRFAQVPEAKVYLDSPHHRVPGYVPLEDQPASDRPRLPLAWPAPAGWE